MLLYLFFHLVEKKEKRKKNAPVNAGKPIYSKNC
jgi:hypothetical protein